MKVKEALKLLDLPPNSPLTPSQVKAAYMKKVWDVHPDRFPPHLRTHAESNFKLISEAYTCLLFPGGGGPQSSTSGSQPYSASYTRVVRSGVPRVYGASSQHHRFVSVPFLFIIASTLGLGAIHASRAYRKQKEANESHNPFLP